jgi:hypothetical protein
MNENMKNMIDFTIKAQSDFFSFVCVVSYRSVHSFETCNWNTLLQHMKLFIVGIYDVISENPILFLDFQKFLGFFGLKKNPQVDEQ